MDFPDKMMDDQAIEMRPVIRKKGNFKKLSDERAKGSIRLTDGFRGQFLYALPLPALESGRQHPLVRPLYAAAIGHFPHAAHHYLERPEGSGEHILILCTAGAGWFEVGGRRKPIEAHQALLIPRKTAHVYGASRVSPWTIHWVHLLGEEADYYVACLPPGGYVIPISPSCEQELVSTFKMAYAAVSREYSQPATIYLSQILRHLMGTLFFNNRAYSALHRSSTTRDLRDTISYIIEHNRDSLSLDGLARHANLSVRTFTRLFQHQTGIAPMKYVIQQRMRNACSLLVSAPLTICEIARQTGYDDPYYFSRIFKQTMGKSPRHYRKSFRQ